MLKWRQDFHRDVHRTPHNVLLVIEVANTTAACDRATKRPLYSAAGITEV